MVVNHVWVVLFGEDVELEDAGVHEVVPDEETILLALEPTVLAGEPDGACFPTYLVVHVVHVPHVPLQLDRLLSHELQRRVCCRLQTARDPRDGVDRLIVGEKAEFEVGSYGLLGAPVLERVRDLPVDIVFDAGKVGHLLLLSQQLSRR